jgi:hypothetical protein
MSGSMFVVDHGNIATPRQLIAKMLVYCRKVWLHLT